MTGIKPLKIDGKTYNVEVDSEGLFVCQWDPTQKVAIAPSLDGLRKRVTDQLRKANRRAAIPVTCITYDHWRHSERPPTFEDGTLTGIHLGHGHPIVSGARGPISKDGELCRRLTDEEKQSFVEAWERKRDAVAAFDALLNGIKLDPEQAITEANSTDKD